MAVAEGGLPGSPRFAALDAARGIALAAMVVFHGAFDLDSLGLAALGVDRSPGWRGFAVLIASSFLFLSGMSLVIAHGKGIRRDAFFRRLAILVGSAALVTLGTWYVMPREFIFFGILHSIAVASLIGLAFLRAPWPVTLIAAILVLIAPHRVAAPIFEASPLRFLGLGTNVPTTLDFEPVFPWLAPFLAGMAATRLALPSFARGTLAGWRPLAWPARALAWAGRHSLAIYLIHQPLMFGTLALLAQSLAGGASFSAEDRPFIEACRETCVSRGGEKPACDSYCGCTADELKKAGLWASVLADRLTPQERQRLAEVMQACARARPAGTVP
ncbi:MAG: heparan-alpha-glucosaminide N-acetyltransferase [Hyphomicrobiales bacterium]